MATTFTIPLVTLPAGSRQFGPAHPADAESSVTLTIDRTPAGGLNSLTGASGLAVDVQQSGDGGATWQDLGGWTAIGGLLPAKGGGSYTVSDGTWNLIPGTSRQLRATVTVSGPSPIAVTGTIVTR